jgi:hypothetical protein
MRDYKVERLVSFLKHGECIVITKLFGRRGKLYASK